MNWIRTSHILLTILVSFIGRTNEKVLPSKILDLLAQVHDADTFGKVFGMKLDVPKSKNYSLERNNDAGVVAMLENEACRPRPIVIEILQPQEKSSFRYPFFVTLHRCMGSCGSNPLLAKCTGLGMEPLKLSVAQISWENSYNAVDLNRKLTHVSVYNETSCNCECSNKVGACDRFRIWREDNCRCECVRYCPSGYVKDENECCKCIKKPKCGRKQLWNPEKCTCECRRKTCRNSKKLRDPKTCRCECKNIQCRFFGDSVDHKTCACRRFARKPEPDNS